jgi:DNA-binding transcriptional LysR family regulator
MKPSLDDLYLFSSVASAGGLIRGAKLLGLPKSTVSRRLAQLERDVDATLIDRDARHFSMTETGRLFAEGAQRMVAAYEETLELLTQQDAKPRGLLRVAMPADFAIFFLADALTSFAKLHPSVTLEIDASPQLVDIVGDRFDLAIRMGRLPDSGLVARKLTTLQRHFYASSAFLKKIGTLTSLGELAQLPFIALQTQGRDLATVGVALKKSKAIFTPETLIRTSSIGLTRALALNGAGVVVLPDVMAQGLKCVLPQVEPLPVEVHFIMPNRQGTPAKTRALMDHLIAACQQRIDS